MKLPKEKRKYCPNCKKHTVHKIMQSKKKQPRSLSYGSKYRARARGRARGHGNLGRYSKPAITKWKMTGKKGTKKTDLRFECKECKKQQMQKKGIRTKKLEFK